jgi:hypothetical protein
MTMTVSVSFKTQPTNQPTNQSNNQSIPSLKEKHETLKNEFNTE